MAAVELKELEPCGTQYGLDRGIVFPEYSEADFEHSAKFGLTAARRHLLVTIAAEASSAAVQALLRQIDAELVGADPRSGLALLRFPNVTDDLGLESKLLELEVNPLISSAGHDIALSTLALPQGNPVAASRSTTPVRGGELGSYFHYDWTRSTPGGGIWGWKHIQAPRAWNLNRELESRGRKIAVAVVDTGFQVHDDLSGILRPGAIFSDEPSPGGIEPDLFSSNAGSGEHGTMMSGIIGARWGWVV